MGRIKLIICMALLIFISHSCRSQKQPIAEKKLPITEESLNLITEDLEGWAEGRWSKYEASYDTNSSSLVLTISASPQANEVALTSYCRVLKDIANKYASGYKFVGKIYINGTVKKTCN